VTGRNLACFRGHSNIVTQVAFSPDGRRLLTGSLDSTFKLWEIHPGETAETAASSTEGAKPRAEPPQRTISGRSAAVAALAFHPHARRFASVGWDGLLRIDDLGTGRTILSVTMPAVDKKSPNAGATGGDASLGAVAYSPDGDLLAVGTGGLISEVKGTVYLIDPETGAVRRQTAALGGPVSALAFGPDGRKLLVATGNVRGLRKSPATVGVYDAASGAQIAAYKGHTAAVLDAAFSHDGSLAATTGFDGGIRIWNSSDGKERRRLGAGTGFRGLAWSPDDSMLAAGGFDSTLSIYQVGDGRLLRQLRGHSTEIYRAAFSPDGKRLASATAELKIWDVASGEELLTERDHSGEIYDVEFSPDGCLLATAGFDGTIVVRNTDQAFNRSTDRWPVIFQDRFDRSELGERWKILGGRWSMENGAARGLMEPMPDVYPGYQGAFIVPRGISLPSTVEVRFECWTGHKIAVGASLNENDIVRSRSSLGLLFTASESLRLANYPPTMVYLKTGDDLTPAWINPRFRLKKDTRYRVRLLREPRQVTLFVDDEEVARTSVSQLSVPFLRLGGGSEARGDSVYFDNVQVRAPADRP
jgi:WD40 repeat protein